MNNIECSYVIRQYNKKTNEQMNDKEKIVILSDIINVNHYICFKDKKRIIEEIIHNNINNISGRYYFNSCDMYFNFINTLLHYYTNINIQPDTYDLLSSNNLLEPILILLGKEYEILNSMLDTYISDIEIGRIIL